MAHYDAAVRSHPHHPLLQEKQTLEKFSTVSVCRTAELLLRIMVSQLEWYQYLRKLSCHFCWTKKK